MRGRRVQRRASAAALVVALAHGATLLAGVASALPASTEGRRATSRRQSVESAQSSPPAVLARAVVVQPAANMFSRASDEADVVSQAPYGTQVSILAFSGGWARIQAQDGYEGWIAMDAVRWLRDAEPPYASAGELTRVSSLFANVYRDPSVTSRRPLVTLPLGTVLEVTRTTGLTTPTTEATPVGSQRPEERWIPVLLADGRPGWIQRGDTTTEWPHLDVAGTIAFAKRFLGVPYLWGGTTSLGLDCSGFMQMLGRRRGFELPRDAGPQSRWDGSVPVERTELAAGDLLYFGSDTKITHTGMYIGDGEFVHATAQGVPSVQVSRLDDEPWTTLLKTCRRVR